MNTIYILWQRQVKKFLRSRSRIVGALGQPLFYLLALGYGFGSIFKQAGQGNYLQFLSPGVVAMTILFTSIFGGIEVIWDKQFGFLKETLVAPVSRLNIMLGRTLGGATVATVQGLLVIILAMIFGFRPETSHLILAVVFIFIMAILFTSLGTGIASVLDDMQGFPIVMQFIVTPMFFLSGSMFPVEGLPKVLGYIVHVNPMTYAVDGLRGLLVNTHHFSYATDWSVLIVVSLIFLAIGSWLFSKIKA
ncbi:ABC transporter permease [Candidatus Parcubacteria bacterium]|nr:ABC transporter permease [Candidatus Parcubacteria bacterium]